MCIYIYVHKTDVNKTRCAIPEEEIQHKTQMHTENEEEHTCFSRTQKALPTPVNVLGPLSGWITVGVFSPLRNAEGHWNAGPATPFLSRWHKGSWVKTFSSLLRIWKTFYFYLI